MRTHDELGIYTMRCREGDLAVVTTSVFYPENIGALLRVIAAHDSTHWYVEALSRVVSSRGSHAPGSFGTCADAQMRPLRNGPDEDQTHEWAGTPITFGEPIDA